MAFIVDFYGVANRSNSSVQTYLNNRLGNGFVTVWGGQRDPDVKRRRFRERGSFGNLCRPVHDPGLHRWRDESYRRAFLFSSPLGAAAR